MPPISNIQLHHRLMRASHLLRHGHGEPELKVAPGQRRVLTNLFENNGALPQQALLELLGIAPATLSEALGKLESRGMIVREKSDKDKRAAIVRLTESGSEQARKILSVDKAVAAEVFAPLDADERRALASALQKTPRCVECQQLAQAVSRFAEAAPPRAYRGCARCQSPCEDRRARHLR